jgi:hypothetical protein
VFPERIRCFFSNLGTGACISSKAQVYTAKGIGQPPSACNIHELTAFGLGRAMP